MDAVTSYRQILLQELNSRMRRNSKYSMRAFARDLDLSAGRLSDVLRGRYGLSRSAALQIAARLKFAPDQAECFADMVASVHARSSLERLEARKRLARGSVVDSAEWAEFLQFVNQALHEKFGERLKAAGKTARLSIEVELGKVDAPTPAHPAPNSLGRQTLAAAESIQEKAEA